MTTPQDMVSAAAYDYGTGAVAFGGSACTGLSDESTVLNADRVVAHASFDHMFEQIDRNLEIADRHLAKA